MILEATLNNIIKEQKEIIVHHKQIKRQVLKELPSGRVLIVSGVRRCGKSTLLRQMYSVDETLYLNFEDPRLERFELSDFQKIESIFKKLDKKYFLFDEIQNVDGWEKAIRNLHEKGEKVFISGSNASMLSRELGTRLTGRYKQVELFPFNYNEFIDLLGLEKGVDSFTRYLRSGGFPEYLIENDTEYLRTLLRDIVTRDIAVRRDIKNENLLIRLAVYFFSNIGKEFSFNNITKNLEIKSVRTTIDYCDYLREAYLLETIPRFSYSIRQQQSNPKKVYCIDTALALANSLSFNEDNGRTLENAVFLHLRRKYTEIFFFKTEKEECDFLVKEGNKIIMVIQVCYNLTHDNLSREINGLKCAMMETGCDIGLIITNEQEDKISEVTITPAWKWITKD